MDARHALAGCIGDADGALAAAMLDHGTASWRATPSAAVARALFDNPRDQRLSTAFAGSTEHMAIEEMCRHAESRAYDLIVLDAPPAAHGLDFLRAPERIDRLLDRDVSRWFTVGRGAWRGLGATARFILRRLEHAAGARTVRDDGFENLGD